MPDFYTKVPRHLLNIHAKRTFDEENPSHEPGFLPLEVSIKNVLEPGYQAGFRSGAALCLNKCQMGVIHIPQKDSESRPVLKDEVQFLVFGGIDFATQEEKSEAFLVTLRHHEKKSYASRLPWADLPHPDTFRGNASLCLGINS